MNFFLFTIRKRIYGEGGNPLDVFACFDAGGAEVEIDCDPRDKVYRGRIYVVCSPGPPEMQYTYKDPPGVLYLRGARLWDMRYWSFFSSSECVSYWHKGETVKIWSIYNRAS